MSTQHLRLIAYNGSDTAPLWSVYLFVSRLAVSLSGRAGILLSEQGTPRHCHLARTSTRATAANDTGRVRRIETASAPAASKIAEVVSKMRLVSGYRTASTMQSNVSSLAAAAASENAVNTCAFARGYRPYLLALVRGSNLALVRGSNAAPY